MIKPYYEEPGIQIFLGDCLTIMPQLEPVDLVTCDLPYEKTNNRWDIMIPIEPLWTEYKRLAEKVVLTAIQPFASLMICSNLDWFKYDLIWKKSRSTGHLNAKIMPLRQHEYILVFSKNKMLYCPQIFPKDPGKIRPLGYRLKSDCYGDFKEGRENRTIGLDESYPKSIIEHIPSVNKKEWGKHPNQKPLKLMKYLLQTYSNEGDLVLDNSMGSGTTLVAAKELGRRCIGIEIEEKYVKIAIDRLRQGVFNFQRVKP